MDYISLVLERGLGPPLLGVFVFFATFYVGPDHYLYAQHPIAIAGSVAIAAVLVLLLFVAILNDRLMRLLAEETLAEAYIQIKLTQGAENEFETDYDEAARTAIDDMDERTHKALLAIIAGVFIAASVLTIGVYKHGVPGVLPAAVVAVLPLLVLSYPYYTRLHRVIEYTARDIDSQHEN